MKLPHIEIRVLLISSEIKENLSVRYLVKGGDAPVAEGLSILFAS